MTTDLSDVLATAKRPEAVVSLCLRGDLLAHHARLEADLAEVLLVEHPSADAFAAVVDPLADEIREVEAEIAASRVEFRLRAIGRLAWEALTEEHPPRPGTDESWNPATFLPALLVASLVSPTGVTAETLDDLYDVLNEGDRQRLEDAALLVNQEGTSVPFSERASAARRWRERRSKQPAPGESPAPSS